MSVTQDSKGAVAVAEVTAAAQRSLAQGTARLSSIASSRAAAEDADQEACEAREAALRQRVAATDEPAREENRAIDLAWERVAAAATPQDALAAMASVQARCAAVLSSKDAVMEAIAAELAARDAAYVELLRTQGEETGTLVTVATAEAAAQRDTQASALEAVEAAYLQERAEAAAAAKAEVDALLARRSSLEQAFMEQYLAACTAYEDQLEALHKSEAAEYSALRRRLDGEVEALETHLDGMVPVYALHRDKLFYNYRILLERERENREALMQQKRKDNRQWEALARLKKRYVELDRRHVGDNARLTEEYQQLMQAFNHLRGKYEHFKAADLRKMEQVRELKEGELAEAVEELRACQAELMSRFDMQWAAAQPGKATALSATLDASKDAIPAYHPAGSALSSCAADYRPSSCSSSRANSNSAKCPALTRDYWVQRTSELAGPQLDMNWGLVERELGKHLAVLQARAAVAKQVTALAKENDELMARVRTALAAGVDRQLPPALVAGAALGQPHP